MRNNTARIESTVREIESIRKTQPRLVIAAVSFTVTLFVILFFVILKITSGVSGQMLLLESYLDGISRGEKPVIRPLRTNDSFHSVFEKLSAIVRIK